jgi:formimidoylglutamate deiminase
MATVHGAHSLGLSTGRLTPGHAADFFTVDLGHPSLAGATPQKLLSAVVLGAEKGAIREVAVAGELKVKDGRHPLAETSGRDFGALARRLYP